jgi:hypothetical protein
LELDETSEEPTVLSFADNSTGLGDSSTGSLDVEMRDL